MRITATIFVILMLTYLVNSSVLDPVIENVVHLKANKPPNSVPGIWKKKTIWKPRWVKEWKSAKVMKPVWRKVWSPVQIREWVPIPKPPPGWDNLSTPLLPIIHPKSQKPVKDSVGHGSHAVHSAKIPLWDPVPYPESQQPPPLPFPTSSQPVACGKTGCDSTPSQTFSHQQISEIIGPRYQTSEYFPNPEFSETVNYQTLIPLDENNWRPPQPLPDIRLDSNFQPLPEFLVPPKFQLLPQITTNPPWVPLPPENKIKGHFITKIKDQPYKFQQPGEEVKAEIEDNFNKENSQGKNHNDKVHPKANRDFIQEAHLVGEYHYSTFDLPNVTPQPVTDEKENIDIKLQQTVVETHKPQQVPLKLQKPQQKINQEILKPKLNQSRVENKQPEIQISPYIQKKHIPNQSSTNSNLFIQQEVISKEALSKSSPQNSFLQNHSTTNLQPVEHSNVSFQIQPLTPIFIPPNHRFSSPLEPKSENNTTFKSEKNNTVQIVFATTPAEYNQSTENLKKSTTTEPYEIIFSSSLQATTEAVTKSSVIIVTPANSKENP